MKKTVKTLAAASALVAMAGAAHAASYDFNIWGASAQKTLWTAIAGSFLKSAAPAGYGCTSAVAQANGYETIGTGCNGAANDTITIRYQSKNSIDGIYAAKGLNAAGNGNTCANSTDRMYGTTCYPVHIGASDVAGESFSQTTTGNLNGPAGGGVVTKTVTPVDTTDLPTVFRPVVVPFGFFVNNGVMVTTCTTGSNAGNLCTAATAAVDCGTGNTCGAAAQIDNISREMAVNIFSGQALYWTDFGASYSVTGNPANNITACLRHAGSGTHATLDHAVMNAGKWGGNLLSNEVQNTGYVWFNDGATQEMDCVNSAPGAIGYADADQAAGTRAVHSVKYNGVVARRNTIRNGLYDFWSAQWLYLSKNVAATSWQAAAASKLNAFASDPANLSATTLAAKAPYWATAGEMVYTKGTDKVYPVWTLPTNPMTP